MTQRKCPKCDGVMSDLYTFQGWGKEGMYACASCGHSKSIYEGTTIGPYIFFLLFEAVIFFLEDMVSSFECVVYGGIFVFLVYRIYKAQMRDNMIGVNYPVIGEFDGDFKPNRFQLDALDAFKKVAIKKGTIIKRAIAILLVIAYGIMLYSEDLSNFGLAEYFVYGLVLVALPVWLWFVKFKGQDD